MDRKHASVPPGLRPLGRLAQYMNFWQIHDDPPVMVTMDHRAVLVAAWAATREGRFGEEPPMLLRLDAHPDMGERPRAWAHELSQMTDLDAVHAIANDQRYDDGGWVISAMQFGLAGSVTTCFVHDYHRFPGDCGFYVDHRRQRHEHQMCASLNELSDFERLQKGPLWIDIDLDFATRRDENDEVRLWNDDDWRREFPESTAALLGDLLKNSALVTISTEPEFCGGHYAVGQIAERLKRINAIAANMFTRL